MFLDYSYNDVFIVDRQTAAIERVSVTGSGGEISDTGSYPSMSDDASVIAFATAMPGLVAGDSSDTSDIFVTHPSFLDQTPPTVTAPKPALAAGGTLASTIPVGFAWTGSDVGSGINHFDFNWTNNGSSYSTIGSSSTPEWHLSLAPGYYYPAQVQAADNTGNVSSVAAGRAFSLSVKQDSSSNITYGAGWRLGKTVAASGGTQHYSATAGATAKLTFTGRSIALAAPLSNTRGSAKIYLDGAYKTTVSGYSVSPLARRLVYAFNWPTSGKHTLTIKVAGTEGYPRFDIDAFAVVA